MTRSFSGSRRGLLRALAGGSLGAAFAAWTRSGAAAPEKPAKPAPPQSTCEIAEPGDNVVTTYTYRIKKAKLLLTVQDVVPKNPELDRVNTSTIRRGKALVMEVEQRQTAAGVIAVTTTYGPAIKGTKQVILVVEGGIVSGNVDGRELVPTATGQPAAAPAPAAPATRSARSAASRTAARRAASAARHRTAAAAHPAPPAAPTAASPAAASTDALRTRAGTPVVPETSRRWWRSRRSPSPSRGRGGGEADSAPPGRPESAER